MMSDVYEEMRAERILQDLQWGEQNHSPEYWLCILIEEVGEAARAYLKATDKKESYKTNIKNYREELIQAGAVIIAMIECFDRMNDE